MFVGDQKDYGEADLVVDESHVIGITTGERSTTTTTSTADDNIMRDDDQSVIITQSENASSELDSGDVMKEAPDSYTTSAPHSFTTDRDDQLVIMTDQTDSENETEEEHNI